MDRDHIIRVILEARDNMSGMLNRANQNFNNWSKKIQNENNNLSRSFDRLGQKSGGFWNSLAGEGGSAERFRRRVQNARSDVDKLTEATRRYARDAVEGFRNAREEIFDIDAETTKRIREEQAGRGPAGIELRRKQAQEDAADEQRLAALKAQMDRANADERKKLVNEIADLETRRDTEVARNRAKFQQDLNKLQVRQQKANEVAQNKVRVAEQEAADKIYAFRREQEIKIARLKDEIPRGERGRNEKLIRAEIASRERIQQFQRVQEEKLAGIRQNADNTRERQISRISNREREIVDKREQTENRIADKRNEVIASERSLLREQTAADKARVDSEVKRQRQIRELRQREQREDLRNKVPDVNAIRGDVEREVEGRRFQPATRVGRASAFVGRAAQNFVVGVNAGANGQRRFNRELDDGAGKLRRIENAFGRAGNSMARFVRNFSDFINFRWFLMISILQVFGVLLVQIGGALVAIGASAVIAAGGLGGAFLAAVTQAIPAIGLLQLALKHLEESMKVVELRDKATDFLGREQEEILNRRRQAAEGLRNAQHGLAQAILSVTDAEQGVADAHVRVSEALEEQRDAARDLVEARREASRRIIDSALDERDAILSVEEAELAVLEARRRLREQSEQDRRADLAGARAEVREAQERLRIAQQEGDQREIAMAASAVGRAQGNLGNLTQQQQDDTLERRRLQIEARRADISLAQARRRREEATHEARLRRSQGVEGQPEVQAAVDRLSDANRSLADSRRDVARADRQLSEAEYQVAKAHRDVAQAQRELALSTSAQASSVEQAKQAFDKLSPAQQRQVLAIERLKKAWAGLGAEIAGPRGTVTDPITDSFNLAIGRIITLLKNPEIREALGDLVEGIADAIDEISHVLIEPETQRQLVLFLKNAALNAPIVGKALANLLRIFLRISEAATPLFNSLLDRFTTFTDKIENATSGEGGMARLERFFEGASEHIDGWLRLANAVGKFLIVLTGEAGDEGLKLVNDLAGAFEGWADRMEKNGPAVRKFFKNIGDSVRNIAPLIGKFVGQLVTAFASPEFQAFTRLMIEVVFPALLTFIGILGKIAIVLNTLFDLPVIGGLLKWTVQTLILFAAFNKLFKVAELLGGGLRILAGAIKLVGRAVITVIIWLTRLLIANPWIAAIVGLVAVIILIYKNWDKVSAALRKVWSVFKSVLGWLGGFAKNLIEGLWGAIKKFAELYLRGWWRLITGYLNIWRRVATWIYNQVKGVVEALWNALKGFVRLYLRGWWHLITTYLNIWKKLAKWVFDGAKAVGKAIVDGIREGIKKAPGLLDALLDKIPGLNKLPKGVRNASGLDVLRRGWGAITREAGGDVPGQEGQAVPIIAHAGEWVLNKGQQKKMAEWLNTTVANLQLKVFGGGGRRPGGTGAQRPIGMRGAPKRPVSAYNLPNGINVLSQEDDSGYKVWFVEMPDGTFGEVGVQAPGKGVPRSVRQLRGGKIPPYVRRNWEARRNSPATRRHQDYLKNLRGSPVARRMVKKIGEFTQGGVVDFALPLQSFAAGGTVMNTSTSKRGGDKQINQKFEIITASPNVDIDYVMRVGQIHAEASY